MPLFDELGRRDSSQLPPDHPRQAHAPLVTIAIPTLNRVGYLRLSLESALAQTWKNIEVVVSNNCSMDDTASYLRSCADPRLRVLEQQARLSMTENWNACLAAATGEYFLLLSDDDLLEPDAIRQLLAGYELSLNLPLPAFIYCGGYIIDGAGAITRPIRNSPPREAARDLILAFFEGTRDLWFCAVLLRTADLHSGFSRDYKVACDAAVWMALIMRYGSAVFIPQPLVRYRSHPNLSAATHLDVWTAENRKLLALVLAEDEMAGRPDPGFAQRLTQLIQTVERNLIVGRINQFYSHQKIGALGEYSRRLSAFTGLRGTAVLAKGVIGLLLGERARNWVRRAIGKGPPPS